MEDIKKVLSTKGAKCNLQFTTAEREYFERECGFTDEELEIFRLRARGFSVVQIYFLMDDKYGKLRPGGTYSLSTVESRIKKIKKKILKVL